MRKALTWFLALFAVALVCGKSGEQVRAQGYTETHYVCPVGFGAGDTDGTSWANCFNGFADIAWDGETEDSDDDEVGPNDKLELRDDDGVYREQLTIGASGLSAKPITIGVESGDSPIISGANLVTGWTEATTAGVSTWTAASQTGQARADDTSPSVENFRNIIESGEISNSGNQVRLALEGHSTGSYNVKGFTIGIRLANDDFDGAPTKLEYSGSVVSSGNAITVGAGLTVWSDWTSYSLDNSTTYLVHVWSDDGFATGSKWDEGSGTNGYLSVDATDLSMTESVSMTVRDEVYQVSEIEVRTVYANVWKATVTTEPNIVLFDGTKGTKDATACPANINASNEWCWDANVLYAYSTSDPDTAFTNPGVESAIRNAVISLQSRTYITVSDLTIQASNYTNDGAVLWNGVTGAGNITLDNLTIELNNEDGVNILQSDNNTIQNCTIRNNDGMGINVAISAGSDTATGNTFSGNTITGNAEWGISLYGKDTTDTADGNTISSNTMSANGDAIYLTNANSNTISGNTCNSSDSSLSALAEGSGIAISDSNSNTVENNSCDSNDIGIQIGGTGGNGASSNIFRHNTVSSSGANGIEITQTDSDDNEIYYNCVFGQTATSAWGIYVISGTGTVVQNNLLHNNYNGIGFDSSAADNLIAKNNIIDNTTVRHLKVAAGITGADIDYNLYGEDGAALWDWLGTTYNFAGWKSNSSQDANSPDVANPLFTDTANDDFTLQAASPAKDAGANLGDTYDDALDPISTWPDNVLTLDQDLYGSGWEIGAYVFSRTRPRRRIGKQE